ncbi:BTAD domain-containing putative transcriptional regulator [Kitasatospora sp. NPDC101235]|uniref:AfsR/SARP family transcriptional regulator n=1 Tax=Kitasatospora sp. NPDC101235 TaxID=3364101 RepID=UPI00381BD20E
MLVAHAGRTVSVPRLVDAVWDESPPATADRQVRNMVGLLRRALSPGPQQPSPIRTDGPGYLLATDKVRVDAQEFTARVDTAARAGTDGAPLLREALDLWRGPALDGLPGRALTTVAAGLEEQRMAALERLFELELAAGRHDRIVPELIGLVGASPLRDGLVRHLLTALLRSGRRAEGLAAYRRYAAHLARELGLDPSSELRSLQQELLGPGAAHPAPPREGEVPRQSPAAAQQPLPRPAQLPWESPAFVGREAQLRAIERQLLGPRGHGAPAAEASPAPAAIALITGAPGAGKSALALRWAHRARGHFPDGQLFTDLHGWSSTGPQHPHAVLGSFLRALGVPAEDVPAQLDETAALYRSMLAGRRVLIVLDNALDAAQVRPLLPGTGGCAVLVTSRDRLTGLVVREGAHRIELADFSPAEGRALVRRVLGAERVEAREQAVARLLDACGHLPLAVALAAARLRDRPHHDLTDFAAELAGNRLDVLSADGDDRSACLRTAFSFSYRALDEPARRLLGLLATSPAVDLSAPVAEVLGGLDRGTGARILRRLADVHLLTEHSADGYRFHDLLRLFAAEQGARQESGRSRRLCLERWYAWCLHQACAAARTLASGRPRVALPPPPRGLDTSVFTDPAQALRWCDEQRANLLATAAHAFEHEDNDVAWKLPSLLWAYLHRTGPHAERLAVGRAAVAAARRLDDRLALGRSLNDLGHAWGAAGDLRQARQHYEQALELVRAAGDRAVEALVLANLGASHFYCADYAAAAEHYERALRLLAADSSSAAQWTVLLCETSLANTHLLLGRTEEAQALAERLLAPEIGLRGGIPECSLLNVIGIARYAAGRPEEALVHFERSLAVGRTIIGYVDQRANSLTARAAAQQALGRSADARRSWEEALAIYRDLPAHYRAVAVGLLTSLGFTPPTPPSPGHEHAAHRLVPDPAAGEVVAGGVGRRGQDGADVP